MKRWICEECDEVFNDAELLRATNPFNPIHEVTGCPNCTAVESMVGACDIPECVKAATFLFRDRATCDEHRPAVLVGGFTDV